MHNGDVVDFDKRVMKTYEVYQVSGGDLIFRSEPYLSSSDNSILQFEPKFNNNILYYEVKVEEISTNSATRAVGVGLAPINYNGGMVGWYKNSIGYHGDDGYIYNKTSFSISYPDMKVEKEDVSDLLFRHIDKDHPEELPMVEDTDDEDWETISDATSEGCECLQKFGEGDIVGVYWNRETGVVIFTLNGVMFRTKHLREDKDLVPTITTDRNITVSVNLGDEPFLLEGILSEKNNKKFMSNMISQCKHEESFDDCSFTFNE